MEIFKTKQALQNYVEEQKSKNLKVALVPTMGALHEGHLSLIAEAQKSAELTVCSIFVNPTQFNDPKDLEKYPKPIANDIALLEKAHCDVLFLPSVEEMYPDTKEEWHIDLGDLDQIWEGAQRPGHFQGVTQIVYKLFTLVKPDIACFGQKDFQQIMVIQKMIDIKDLPIEIIICPIIRDSNGLALSSRNVRLSDEGKKQALALSKTLYATKAEFGSASVQSLQEQAEKLINDAEGVELEYFAICESRSLKEVDKIEANKTYVALIVAWVDQVRLIDNMILND